MVNTAAVHDRMRQVLVEAIRILFPVQVNPDDYIIPHTWRNVDYVGQVNGTVSYWKGWSANFEALNNGYRTFYIDQVANNLPLDEKTRLFGESFVAATENKTDYVIGFVADIKPSDREVVEREGFLVRVMGRTIHACFVASADDFNQLRVSHHAVKLVQLANLQRYLLSVGLE